MSYQINKYRKVILDPISNLNELINKAETLYNIEEKKSKTTRENIFLKSNHQKSKSINKSNYNKTRNIINERLYKSNTFDSDNFNVLKTIKNIKQITNDAYYSNDPFMKNKFRIGFDKNNSKYIFQSRKQINEYKKRRANILMDRNGSLNKFLHENKFIGINNYIIKFLNNESQKLINKENENDKKLENNELNLINNNNNFINCIRSQNHSLKQIEKCYSKIGEVYRKLLREEYQEKILNKSIDDEMEKIINNLEELRILCKFISELTNVENNKFNNEIIGKKNKYLMHLNPENFDFTKITNKAINNYKFCLERNEEEEKELNEMLDDANNLEIKFHQIEDRIIRLLDLIQQIKLDEKIMKKEENNIIYEMNERLNFHQREYNLLKDIYESELENMKKLPHSDNNYSSYCFDLIKDIYKYILELEHKNNKINLNQSYNSLHYIDLINDCISKIKNKEDKINILTHDLETFEIQNPDIFIEIINDRKNYNKEKKQKEKIKKLEEINDENKKKSENRFNKVIIKSRKTEAPFRIFKKIVKKSPQKELGYNPEYDMILYK